VFEWGQTVGQSASVDVDLLTLDGKHVDVQSNQVQIRLGTSVDSSSQLVLELLGGVLDTRVDSHAHLGQALSHFVRW
jgi:hypothetical protein